jgi:hypothetical protein
VRFDSFIVIFAFPLVACGGSGATILDAPDAARSAKSDSSVQAGPDAQTSSGAVTIHLRATTAPFAHHDGFSGQTPSDQRLAIKSLSLGASADDPSPWLVFALGTDAVLAGVNDGDDSVIATVPDASLRPGSYSYAKVGVAYVRYSVAATVHADGLAVPGTFDSLEVLSSGTLLDGTTYSSGYSTFTFVVGSETFGPVTETSAPLPTSAGLGIGLSIVDGQAAYGFPIAIEVAREKGDFDLTMLANTNEDFRWKDEDEPGYAPGVFDVTPPSSYEPVEQFGPNSLTLSIVPKT